MNENLLPTHLIHSAQRGSKLGPQKSLLKNNNNNENDSSSSQLHPNITKISGVGGGGSSSSGGKGNALSTANRRALGDITNARALQPLVTPGTANNTKKRPRSKMSLPKQSAAKHSSTIAFSIFNDMNAGSVVDNRGFSYDDEPETFYNHSADSIQLPPVTYNYWSSEEHKFVDMQVNTQDIKSTIPIFKTRRQNLQLNLSASQETIPFVSTEPTPMSQVESATESTNDHVSFSLMGQLISDSEWSSLW